MMWILTLLLRRFNEDGRMILSFPPLKKRAAGRTISTPLAIRLSAFLNGLLSSCSAGILAGWLPVLATSYARAETYNLGSLDLSTLQQSWGTPHADQSVDGHPLSIGGRKFAQGLGTHAESRLRLALHGQGERFTASVGVDDEVGSRGNVIFKINGDGKLLWQSGPMRGGDAAK